MDPGTLGPFGPFEPFIFLDPLIPFDRRICNVPAEDAQFPPIFCAAHQVLPLRRGSGMGVKKLEDLIAYQLAVEGKKEVYRLVQNHPHANEDLRYRSQLFEAAASMEANIAEGWRRYSARDMSRFLKFALGSAEEVKRRVTDGVHRGYFTEADCEAALTLTRRCGAATMGLWKSLQKRDPDNP